MFHKRHLIREKGAKPVMPPRRVDALPKDNITQKGCYDVQTCRKRHIIERLFGRLKKNKRITMRFDKRDSNFLSFIALALMKAYDLVC
jgi:transposase